MSGIIYRRSFVGPVTSLDSRELSVSDAVLDEKASVEVQLEVCAEWRGASGRQRLLPVITECFPPGYFVSPQKTT